MSYIDKIVLNGNTYNIGNGEDSSGYKNYIEVDPETFTIDEAYEYYNNGISRFMVRDTISVEIDESGPVNFVCMMVLNIYSFLYGYGSDKFAGAYAITFNISTSFVQSQSDITNYTSNGTTEMETGAILFKSIPTAGSGNRSGSFDSIFLQNDNINKIRIVADDDALVLDYWQTLLRPVYLKSNYTSGNVKVHDPKEYEDIANKGYVDTTVKDLNTKISSLESTISTLQSTVNSLNSFLNTNMRNMLTTIYNG